MNGHSNYYFHAFWKEIYRKFQQVYYQSPILPPKALDQKKEYYLYLELFGQNWEID